MLKLALFKNFVSYKLCVVLFWGEGLTKRNMGEVKNGMSVMDVP